jgi:outer membrane biosynthesis protein TonB
MGPRVGLNKREKKKKNVKKRKEKKRKEKKRKEKKRKEKKRKKKEKNRKEKKREKSLSFFGNRTTISRSSRLQFRHYTYYAMTTCIRTHTERKQTTI